MSLLLNKQIPVYQADKGKQMPQYPRVLTLIHSETFHNNTLKTISANLLKQQASYLILRIILKLQNYSIICICKIN